MSARAAPSLSARPVSAPSPRCSVARGPILRNESDPLPQPLWTSSILPNSAQEAPCRLSRSSADHHRLHQKAPQNVTDRNPLFRERSVLDLRFSRRDFDTVWSQAFTPAAMAATTSLNRSKIRDSQVELRGQASDSSRRRYVSKGDHRIFAVAFDAHFASDARCGVLHRACFVHRSKCGARRRRRRSPRISVPALRRLTSMALCCAGSSFDRETTASMDTAAT